MSYFEAKAIRLWRELTILRAGGVLTSARIAESFDVDVRTAERDLEVLRTIGPDLQVLSRNPMTVRCRASDFDRWMEVQR